MLLLMLTAAAAPRLDQVRVLGPLDASLIETVLDRRAEALDACLVSTDPRASLTLSLALRRDKPGAPQDVAVVERRRTDDVATACLIDAIQGTVFFECLKGMPREIQVQVRVRPSLQ